MTLLPKTTEKYGAGIQEIGIVALAALITTLVSLVGFPIITAALTYRQLVKWYLQYSYNGRFIIMNGMDAASSLETPPKTLGYCVCLLLSPKIPFQLENMEAFRSKIVGHLSTEFYKKLKYKACVKLGLCCWEDLGLKKDAVDIQNHVKLCPGADSWTKVYSENEMMRVLQNVVNSDMNANTRPTWEVLVIPQVRTKAKASQAQVALIARMNHGYMDGRSFKAFLQQCLFDDDLPPTVGQPTLIRSDNIFEIGSCILRTLYSIIIDVLCHRDSKLPGNTSSDVHRIAHINVENITVSRIRKAFKCETLTVFCNALMTALKELSNKKGIPIPNSLNVAMAANISHSQSIMGPTNIFNMFTKCIQFTGSDMYEQLAEINRKILDSPKSSKEGEYRLLKLTGCLPVSWIRLLGRIAAFCSIVMTTFPMSEQIFRVQGSVVTSFAATLRPVYGTVCTLCPVYYGGTFVVGLAVSDIDLVKNDLDMAALTEYFRKQIQKLEKLAAVGCSLDKKTLHSGT